MLQHGSLDDNQRIFTPTVIWLIGNVVADLLITIIFTVHLRRLKKGTTRSSTGSFANSLIRLAFETCAIPLFVTLFSAIMRAISTLSHALAHVSSGFFFRMKIAVADIRTHDSLALFFAPPHRSLLLPYVRQNIKSARCGLYVICRIMLMSVLIF